MIMITHPLFVVQFRRRLSPLLNPRLQEHRQKGDLPVWPHLPLFHTARAQCLPPTCWEVSRQENGNGIPLPKSRVQQLGSFRGVVGHSHSKLSQGQWYYVSVFEKLLVFLRNIQAMLKNHPFLIDPQLIGNWNNFLPGERVLRQVWQRVLVLLV